MYESGPLTVIGINPPSGGGFDSATTAWIAAVVAAGGSVSTTQKGYVDTLIKALKANGVFSIIDRIWLLGSENTQQANIDIVNLGTWTYHGTPALSSQFTANVGITGDNSTVFLDLNFNPATAGGNFALNSGTIGAYNLSNRTGNQPWVCVGGADGAAISVFFRPNNASGNFEFEINNNNFPSFVSGQAQGFWNVSRSSSANINVYKNGSAVSGSPFTDASFSVPSTGLYAFALDNNGATVNFSADQMSALIIGGGLTPTQNTNFQAAINAYMTSLGINVY